MPYMSGAEVLVDSLVREGVEVIFGLPGVQVMDAVDAIYREKSIRWISTRHEQTAAYMAYGYARTTDKIGVAMVLPGPGALNTTAAIGTAYTASTPVLLISGQIESYHLGLHRGVLHELDEQIEIFRHLTKWCGRVSKVTEIPEVLQEVLNQLKTGRPRPVEIEVPFDLWAKKAEMSPVMVEKEARAQPDPDDIKKAADLLSNAKRPLILAGGGAAKSDVVAEITQLAERLKAPVVMTTEGQGAIHCMNPWCAGNFVLWTNPAFSRADVILIVGSRLRAPGNTKLELRPDQKTVQIDVDSEDLRQNQQIEVGIAADVSTALTELLGEVSGSHTSQWQTNEVAEIRAQMKARMEKEAPVQMAILGAIHEVLPEENIIVPDITNVGYWCDLAYPINTPRNHVDSSYFATLGFAFPTALGAKIGNPDKPVIALCGDGGFPYAAMELATAVQEGIPVITLLFSDSAYGTVTGIQRRQFGSRFIGNKLHNPDYVKFSESFGAIGIKLSHHDELGATLRSVLKTDRPVVIEVPVPLMETPWDTLLEDKK